MTDTIKVPVTPAEGWKLITTGSGGVFTASGPCYYYFGVVMPIEMLTGHRLDTGDIQSFILKPDESLWVRSQTSNTVVVSVTGAGFAQSWFEQMTRAEKALTSQSYLETNCKKGTQWGLSLYNATLAANAISYVRVQTGAKPIALKGRTFGYDGLGIISAITENPIVTGGTDITALVFNYNRRNPQTLLTQIFATTTLQVTSVGTPWVPDRHYLGNSKQGSNARTIIDREMEGLEFWFAENSSYLVKLQSLDPADTQRVSQFATFYEGFPDLP